MTKMETENLYGMDMTKVMFGINAIRLPIWMVAQNNQTAFPFAGASRFNHAMFGSNKTHTLITGEMIIRPRLVIATDEFIGRGIGGFWTDIPTPEEWLKNGDILIEP